MRLQVPKVDGRTQLAELKIEVRDLDAGKAIGYVRGRQRMSHGMRQFPSRVISLFDDKYVGNFETHEECVAFAKGIEAVLNHLESGVRAAALSETNRID